MTAHRPALTRGKRDTVRRREQLAAASRRTADASHAADTTRAGGPASDPPPGFSPPPGGGGDAAGRVPCDLLARRAARDGPLAAVRAVVARDPAGGRRLLLESRRSGAHVHRVLLHPLHEEVPGEPLQRRGDDVPVPVPRRDVLHVHARALSAVHLRHRDADPEATHRAVGGVPARAEPLGAALQVVHRHPALHRVGDPLLRGRHRPLHLVLRRSSSRGSGTRGCASSWSASCAGPGG